MRTVKAKVLATRILSNVDPGYAEKLGLTGHHRSLAMLTSDLDDALFAALDSATKFAQVDVVYARSFYAGSSYPSGPLSGEAIGMLGGPNPAEVRSGLDACVAYLEEEALFHSADENDELLFFPHLINSTGSYLSAQAGIERGRPLAYLIGPPLEASYALDLAVKAAEVTMQQFYGPPTETNFAGALLTGTQSACRAACNAFRDGVLDVAHNPINH